MSAVDKPAPLLTQEQRRVFRLITRRTDEVGGVRLRGEWIGIAQQLAVLGLVSTTLRERDVGRPVRIWRRLDV